MLTHDRFIDQMMSLFIDAHAESMSRALFAGSGDESWKDDFFWTCLQLTGFVVVCVLGQRVSDQVSLRRSHNKWKRASRMSPDSRNLHERTNKDAHFIPKIV